MKNDSFSLTKESMFRVFELCCVVSFVFLCCFRPPCVVLNNVIHSFAFKFLAY